MASKAKESKTKVEKVEEVEELELNIKGFEKSGYSILSLTVGKPLAFKLVKEIKNIISKSDLLDELIKDDLLDEFIKIEEDIKQINFNSTNASLEGVYNVLLNLIDVYNYTFNKGYIKKVKYDKMILEVSDILSMIKSYVRINNSVAEKALTNLTVGIDIVNSYGKGKEKGTSLSSRHGKKYVKEVFDKCKTVVYEDAPLEMKYCRITVADILFNDDNKSLFKLEDDHLKVLAKNKERISIDINKRVFTASNQKLAFVLRKDYKIVLSSNAGMYSCNIIEGENMFSMEAYSMRILLKSIRLTEKTDAICEALEIIEKLSKFLD